MSKAFLNQILRIENSIQSDVGHSCYICFQECGTLCPESGVIEVAVRLPCQHAIGSACIAKWLHTNNTCPMCREVFFPLEHEDTDDEEFTPSEHDFSEGEGEDPQALARNLCNHYCAELHVSAPIANLAEKITAKMCSSDLLERARFAEDAAAPAAACVYMATHLMGEPRTFEEIARVANIRAFSAFAAYGDMYGNHAGFIEDSWADDPSSGNLRNAISLLPEFSVAEMEDSIQETIRSEGIPRAW